MQNEPVLKVTPTPLNQVQQVKESTPEKSETPFGEKQKMSSGPVVTKEMTEDQLMAALQANIWIIVRLQAWARGNRARKQIKFMKSKQIGSSRYFTFEEYKETVNQNSQSVDDFMNQPRQIKESYTYKTGSVYTGEWKGGFRDGQGSQTWRNGAQYEGEWKDNKAYGNGKFTHEDGDTYEGQWANDKANGFGVYTHVNGAKYCGEWKDDLQHGNGVETWMDGSKYEGCYSYGRKHGLGTY